MTSISNYQIYCNTEGKYVSGWGETAPITCYNDIAHNVNVNSIQLINTVSTNLVSIDQKKTSQAGKFYIESIYLNNIGTLSTKTVNYTFDVPMSLFSFNFALNNAQSGDTFSIIINPDTPVGLITADAKSGNTVLNVSSAVIGFMYPGFFLTIDNGTNTNTNMKILSRNLVDNTVTVKGGVTSNYSAANSQLYLNYYCIKDMPIVIGTTYSFGGEIINASNVAAGTVARFVFKNNGLTSKDVAVYLSGQI